MSKQARKLTNKQLTNNPLFKKACKLAGVDPSPRQASKFFNGRRGQALKFKHEAQQELNFSRGVKSGS